MKTRLLLFLFTLLFTHAQAQVTGSVRDRAGAPLIGALVKWVDAPRGVLTDAEGHFSLPARTGATRVAASYVGYEKDTLVATAGQALHFVLDESGALAEVTVVAKKEGNYKSFSTIEHRELVTTAELCRAACCNLGESFETNPSVDVSYSDAATGAKQIRLLGLSGTYVQMLAENIPAFRIAAAPFGLGYVPGPWMSGIAVSKGIASVKNGYEAITGQIDVEYKKPDAHEADLLGVNLFGDSNGRVETNAETTLCLPRRWSTTLLAHYEKETTQHDGNHDGFTDTPGVEQYNLLNRWAYKSANEKYVLQAGVKALGEWRESGQTNDARNAGGEPRYRIAIDTKRYEAFGKQAYIFNKEHNTNIALLLAGSWHDQDAAFGLRRYDVKQTGAYASLLFETEFSPVHALSTGVSFNYDGFSRRERREHNAQLPLRASRDHETSAGGFAQYTLSLPFNLTAMAGLRLDHTNLLGTFVTPRLHLKYTPSPFANFRLSAGKGYRSAHLLDENSYLLSGSRRVELSAPTLREEAWNVGVNTGFKIPLGEHLFNINLEYYYTDFQHQAVIDYDADAHAVQIYPLTGRCYSHVAQAEVSYELLEGLTLTAAYRYTDAQTDYRSGRRSKPLTSRYKALLSTQYKTPGKQWQFDATLCLNGGGRMPEPYLTAAGQPAWQRYYSAFPALTAQVTRYFKQWSVYLGGENLTAFKQRNPIIDAGNPWGNAFDPTMIYGPMHGAKVYLGVRFNLPAKHDHAH